MGVENLSLFIDQLATRIHDYISQGESTKAKTVSYLHPDSRRRTTDLSLPLSGNGSQAVLDDVDEFLRQSVKTNRSEFMNPLWGGMNISAFAGEVIAALTNQSMYTYELSPLATLIEQAIMNRMLEIIGFADGIGTLTTGGSNGNMLGLLCARQSMLPNSSHTGFDGQKFVAFVSSESHYSVLMSANVIGIGHQNLIKVACDSQGRMKPESLIEEISRAKAENLVPLCIVATSGTTVRGAFDPIKEIANIAHDHNIWLHVDAAWGGSCLFSSNFRLLMDGVEMADSVCWDAHKMMGMPLICSAFLTKHEHILRNLCNHVDTAHYLFHEDSRDFDLGRYSLQCGRRNDSLKLWLAWREIGDSGWSEMVESYCKLADYLETVVKQNPKLEMMSTRVWTNVCFRYKAAEFDLDDLNIEIRNRMMHEGIHLVSRSNINGNIVIRAVISNPNVNRSTLDSLVDTVIKHGDEISSGIPPRF